MESEIIDNLKDKMNIKVLEKILEQNKLSMDNNIVIDSTQSNNNINNV
jgi:hypothetical protein